jgi:phosphinothricin acetyltransferase
MAPIIRPATERDAEQILAIYAPIVRDTTISFELEPPTADEMKRRIAETLVRWPWLVFEHRGEILAYASAGPHRARAAYRWSVDVSAYVHPKVRRRSIGRALYTCLFEILVLQGFYNAYAGIALPNPPSVALHESLGFHPVGVYRGVGFKLGAWRDVGWWHLSLQPKAVPSGPPIDFAVARESPRCAVAMTAVLRTCGFGNS